MWQRQREKELLNLGGPGAWPEKEKRTKSVRVEVERGGVTSTSKSCRGANKIKREEGRLETGSIKGKKKKKKKKKKQSGGGKRK